MTARLPPGKVSIRRAFAVGFEFRQTVRPFLSMFLIFFQAMFLQKSVAGQFVSVSEYVHVSKTPSVFDNTESEQGGSNDGY